MPTPSKIISALMLREAVTRYGREGFGFLWVIFEPLFFCVGVIVMWSLLRPTYDHGVRVAPFVMTGYMCLLLIRHMMGMSVGAMQANTGLLYHRQITVFQIFVSRNLLEFAGATVAFVLVYIALLVAGEVEPPHSWALLYGGWVLMGWISFGIAFALAGLALRYEFLERLTSVVGYLMIPFSGAFVMAGWIPERWRELYLLIPMPHAVEMVRGGVFGEFVPTYYDPIYALAWGAGLILVGLVAVADARDRILID
ncbi:ABC transporter [Brevundimonas sp. AAP58]|nr:ABC transporter [Brevundimonas sp. AAP58]